MEEDKYEPGDTRTAKVVRDIANSICGMIQMEEDTPSQHQTKRLPILDLEVWVQEGQVKHQFFRKSVSTRKMVMARSAFSNAKKRSILVAEGLRRLRNCSPEDYITSKIRYLNEMAVDMMSSGHAAHFRKIVIEKALDKYMKEIGDWKTGGPCIYRSRSERRRL